jgi:hypothetical protein
MSETVSSAEKAEELSRINAKKIKQFFINKNQNLWIEAFVICGSLAQKAINNYFPQYSLLYLQLMQEARHLQSRFELLDDPPNNIVQNLFPEIVWVHY